MNGDKTAIGFQGRNVAKKHGESKEARDSRLSFGVWWVRRLAAGTGEIDATLAIVGTWESSV